MSLVIPKEVIDGITFEANYETYVDTLLRLDKKRFRGLGEEHTEKFILHAVDYADRVGLTYVNDIAYVMMIMSYLGSYFYEDFRYQALTAQLEKEATLDDYRVETAREEFIKIGSKFIGKGMSYYKSALEEFLQKLLPDFENGAIRTDDLPERLVDCYKTKIIEEQRKWFAEKLINNGKIAAHELCIFSEEGIRICIVLSFWLGVGFYKDPLYPWVRDMLANNSASIDERIAELSVFAKKRLALQLKQLEG